MMQEGRATKGGTEEGDKGAAAPGVYKEGEGKVAGRAVFFGSRSLWLIVSE